MRICTIQLRSITAYSQSKFHGDPSVMKGKSESFEDYDLRTFRDKATVNGDNIVCIPAVALKQAIDEAARRMSEKRKGNTTWAKYFVSGQMCEDDVPLGINKDELHHVKIYANLDGVRGGRTRGMRYFPIVQKWKATANFFLFDEAIPEDIFEQTVAYAGKLVGIGRYRPEKGGSLGRFAADKFSWSEAA